MQFFVVPFRQFLQSKGIQSRFDSLGLMKPITPVIPHFTRQ